MKYKYNTFNTNEFESHKLAYGLIEENTKVLDLGCATGYFAKELRKKHCVVWGVDYEKEAVAVAGMYCKKAVCLDLNTKKSLPFPKKHFDQILLLDVIEHLQFPENVLEMIKPYLKSGGSLLISVPNIAHASMRWSLLKGQFTYTAKGILDRTHLHFYTQKSLGLLLRDSGFKIVKMVPTNGLSQVPFLSKITDRLPKKWQYRIACIFPRLFSFQFIALARLR